MTETAGFKQKVRAVQDLIFLRVQEVCGALTDLWGTTPKLS